MVTSSIFDRRNPTCKVTTAPDCPEKDDPEEANHCCPHPPLFKCCTLTEYQDYERSVNGDLFQKYPEVVIGLIIAAVIFCLIVVICCFCCSCCWLNRYRKRRRQSNLNRGSYVGTQTSSVPSANGYFNGQRNPPQTTQQQHQSLIPHRSVITTRVSTNGQCCSDTQSYFRSTSMRNRSQLATTTNVPTNGTAGNNFYSAIPPPPPGLDEPKPYEFEAPPSYYEAQECPEYPPPRSFMDDLLMSAGARVNLTDTIIEPGNNDCTTNNVVEQQGS